MAVVVGEVVSQIEPPRGRERDTSEVPGEPEAQPPPEEQQREVLATLERRARRLEAD